MIDQEQLQADRDHEKQTRLDLQDLRALKQSTPFQRYFLRRLRDKRDAIFKEFRHGKVSPEERETLKRILDEIEPLTTLLDDEEKNILAELDRRR